MTVENQQLTVGFVPECPQSGIAPVFPDVPCGPLHMLDTRHKGEEATLRVQIAAMRKGYIVSKPTMEGCRYDLILDDGKKLHRVQCKYVGLERSGTVRIMLEKYSAPFKTRCYSPEEIDALVVYVAPIDRLLWLPSDVWAHKTGVHLRLTPAVNGQKKGVYMVKDYYWG